MIAELKQIFINTMDYKSVLAIAGISISFNLAEVHAIAGIIVMIMVGLHTGFKLAPQIKEVFFKKKNKDSK